LEGALYLAPHPVPVSRTWLAGLLDAPTGAGHQGLRVLAGRPGGDRLDEGAIVCTCNQVGANRIAAAIAAGAETIDAVGRATGAATTCGSCRSDIKRMLDYADADRDRRTQAG
jgi:assimilatory nitrate reductase catalytic subunit